MIQEFLTQIGLSDKEAKVYLTLLQIGTNAVNLVAKKSGLGRTTVYSVLETLDKKGFVNFFDKNGVHYYTAERPEMILSIFDKEERELNIRRNKFRHLMPEFLSLISSNRQMPKVKYFDGIDGIKKIYEDTLQTGEDKFAYSCVFEIEDNELRNWLDEYVCRRVKKGIKAQAIFPDTPEARKHVKNDKKYLRESKLVPQKDFPFKSEINIYGNKIASICLTKPYYGVIVESREIVETQRSIFKLAWLGAGNF